MAAKSNTLKSNNSSKPKTADKKAKSKKKSGWGKRIWRWFKIFCIIFIVMTILPVILYKFLPVPYTPLMFIRYAENKIDGKPAQIKHDWVDLDEMSSKLMMAAVAAEDDKFIEHTGFDFDAIQKAYKNNQVNKNKKKKRIIGGSTISQQTAKNVFLWPGRSWLRKGLEAYFTILIEFIWGKERIIEVYLNSVEMGDGIYGVEAAAQEYYKKSAEKLNKYEAAAIISVLPSPRKWKVVNPQPYVLRRQQSVVRRMSRMEELKFD